MLNNYHISEINTNLQKIEKNKIILSYNNIPLSFIAVLVNSFLLSYVHWNQISNTQLFIWQSLVLLITLWRYTTYKSFKINEDNFDIDRWKKRFFVGAILSGLIWGLASLIMFNSGSILHQTFLLLIIVGLGAGAISSFATDIKSVRWFLILSLVPQAFVLSIQDEKLYNILSYVTLMYLIMMLIIAKHFHDNILKTLTSQENFSHTKSKLSLSEQRLESIFNNAPVGIFMFNNDMKIIESNQMFATILGTSLEKLVGLSLNDLKDKSVLPVLLGTLKGESGYYEGSYITTLSNEDIYVTLQTSTLKDEQENIIGGIGIVSDITKQTNAQKKIYQQAYYDSLTDIPNKMHLLEILDKEISNFNKTKNIASVLFLDLDNFKNINDSLGHNIGDTLLQKVSQRLLNTIQETDTLARLGGDEFVIILPNLGEDIALAIKHTKIISQKILNSMKEPFNNVNGYHLNISSSIGIAMIDDINKSRHNILQYADTAMYSAKEAGKDQMKFYTLNMFHSIQNRLQLENSLREAIKNNCLMLYYQPVIDMKTYKIIGAEALIRWNHNKLGYIDPEELIAIAENNGSIIEIGNWVLNSAIKEFKKWKDLEEISSHLSTIAINVSLKQFMHPDFTNGVMNAIKKYKLEAKYIELELTESIIVKNIDEVIDKMNLLKSFGVNISIDDFGTGYSSLSHLKKLPFSTLKIDKSFTQDVDKNKTDAMLVETTINMAKSFNLKIIAEGVETQKQFEFMQKRGCDFYQGFLCSPAVTSEEFVTLLHKNCV